jgi:hypothetical protein
MCVAPLFSLEFILGFADDTFIPGLERCQAKLITDIENSLEAITKRLRQSSFLVNQDKTEICLYYKKDVCPITCSVEFNRMNFLGVIFDSILKCSYKVSHCIQKTMSTIKQICRYFNKNKLLKLLSNYNSFSLYNSQMWNLAT